MSCGKCKIWSWTESMAEKCLIVSDCFLLLVVCLSLPVVLVSCFPFFFSSVVPSSGYPRVCHLRPALPWSVPPVILSVFSVFVRSLSISIHLSSVWRLLNVGTCFSTCFIYSVTPCNVLSVCLCNSVPIWVSVWFQMTWRQFETELQRILQLKKTKNQLGQSARTGSTPLFL